MGAFRKTASRRDRAVIVAQLNYWRQIRLDNPSRKPEAMAEIDALLDKLIEGT